MPSTGQDGTLEALQDAYEKLINAWSENEKLRELLGLKPHDAIPNRPTPSALKNAPNSNFA